MSLIVYGPTGCGKTRFAEQLRQHLGCLNVIDDAEWPKNAREWANLKKGNDLLLITAGSAPSMESIPSIIDDRRIFYFDDLADELGLLAPDATEHPLYPVFMAAIEQAMSGKGVRHGGDTTPFLEQPWAHYAKMHGRGFLTGQAAKKLEEAAQRNGASFEVEILGAIVYAGMALLKERGDA